METSFYIRLKGRAVFWSVAIIFIVTGCIFAFGVPALMSKSEKNSFHATAHVLSVSEKNGMYHTAVEFQTADGEVIHAVSSTSSNFKRAEGTEVEIIYNKSDPHDVSFTADMYTMKYIFRITGIILLLIGSPVFLLTLVSLYVSVKSPENETAFFWWINFSGGLAGALIFAIPSTLIYPIFKLLPENIQKQAQNASILLPVFTAVGLLASTGIFFIARRQFRARPRWK